MQIFGTCVDGVVVVDGSGGVLGWPKWGRERERERGYEYESTLKMEIVLQREQLPHI